MKTVSLASAKARLSELLDSVEAGGEVVITRHGRAIARITPADRPKEPLPLSRLAKLRKETPAWGGKSSDALRALRDAE